ncbi:hypothetical protein [Vibrio pelagius]|uniref:hypothetical protein n=1 Tax=Vibrio pelagius TaxID=28169 RepID=UPI003550E32A
MKTVISISLLVLLTGCTHNQSKALNANTSPVNVYAQSMSNMQLCDTLYYGRPSNQTLAAIGAEFNRRGLSKSWCDTEANKLYLTQALNWLAQQADNSDEQTESDDSAVILPVN